MNSKTRSKFGIPVFRKGTTLAEVLISLLIMSVGVIPLMVLFPISTLRTLQATNLTNATNLRYNAEAMVDTLPLLYLIGKSWTPGTEYKLGDIVTPTDSTSLKMPVYVFQCVDTTLVGPAVTPTVRGTYYSGATEPLWNYTNATGGVMYTVDTAAAPTPTAKWAAIALDKYVVDPLGMSLEYVPPPGISLPIVESRYRTTDNVNYFFGNDGTNPYTGFGRIRAFSGIGVSWDYVAESIAGLVDNYVTQLESVKVTYAASATQCNLGDASQAMSSYTAIPPERYNLPFRIVFFDITGKISHVRPIYQIDATTGLVSWTPITPNAPSEPNYGPLPTNFVPVRARIESRDRRYSWMLSVRRGFSGAAYLDVVTFYKRAFSGKDEQLYPATFTQTTDFGADQVPGNIGDDDGNKVSDFGGGAADPTEIGYPGSDDTPRNWVIVQYESTGNKPFVKKGGFVADADTLRWYRITDIVEGDAFNGYTPDKVLQKAGIATGQCNSNAIPSTTSHGSYIPDDAYYGPTNTRAIFLRLESPVAQSGNQPATNGGSPKGNAIIMRGIVDVFPIRTHLTWEK